MVGEGEDLLKCKMAVPSALRFPSKGSKTAAFSGSISTLNLERASCVLFILKLKSPHKSKVMTLSIKLLSQKETTPIKERERREPLRNDNLQAQIFEGLSHPHWKIHHRL